VAFTNPTFRLFHLLQELSYIFSRLGHTLRAKLADLVGDLLSIQLIIQSSLLQLFIDYSNNRSSTGASSK
jgi:hypothetical protein